MKRIIPISILLSVIFSLFAVLSVDAAESVLNQFDRQQQEELSEYRQMLFDGKISQDTYQKAQLLMVYKRQYLIWSNPDVAREYLDEEAMINDQSCKKMARRALDRTELDTEDIWGYYAEAMGIAEDDVSHDLKFTFSEPIPLSENNELLAIGEGYLTEENLKQYVSAWIFVGYADGEPFGVFQVSGPEGEYHISGIVPDVQTAVAYDSLLDIKGCYITSAMTAPEISYLVVKDGVVQSVHQRDAATLETTDITTNAKDTEFYYYARRIFSLRGLEVEIENYEAELLGENATKPSYTFEDAKRQATYELYIRPYLIPTVIVLAVGAAVAVIIIRKRKQKKA